MAFGQRQTNIVAFVCHAFGLLASVSSPSLAGYLLNSHLWVLLALPEGFLAPRRHLSSESWEVYSPLPQSCRKPCIKVNDDNLFKLSQTRRVQTALVWDAGSPLRSPGPKSTYRRCCCHRERARNRCNYSPSLCLYHCYRGAFDSVPKCTADTGGTCTVRCVVHGAAPPDVWCTLRCVVHSGAPPDVWCTVVHSQMCDARWCTARCVVHGGAPPDVWYTVVHRQMCDAQSDVWCTVMHSQTCAARWCSKDFRPEMTVL